MTPTSAAVIPLYTLVIEDRCDPSILERVMREVEPQMKCAAACIAEDYPAVRPDLVQEARITLWQLDLGRFPQGKAAYLWSILRNRMYDVYVVECRHGLTTARRQRAGWKKKQ